MNKKKTNSLDPKYGTWLVTCAPLIHHTGVDSKNVRVNLCECEETEICAAKKKSPLLLLFYEMKIHIFPLN